MKTKWAEIASLTYQQHMVSRVLLNFIEFIKVEKRWSKSAHVFFVKCPYILCLSVCGSMIFQYYPAWATCGVLASVVMQWALALKIALVSLNSLREVE